MHGYGVACFTAKCRRRTAAPRRSPFTYSTYPLQALPPSFLFPLSPLPPSVALSSSGPPPILVLALLRHPCRGFLSSVSLCLPFPRRAVASRAAFATRARTLLTPSCMHISIAYSSSLAYRSLPAMHAASPSHGAHFSGLARDDRIRRITPCVFSTSRGEPRSLALTRARISGSL